MIRWLVLAGVLALRLPAAELEPLTDLGLAVERAKAEKKLVFVEFTGSDWCIPCIKFEQHVMGDAKFVEFVAKRLVPGRLDIPYRKNIDAELKRRNEALAEKHEVKIYPTFLILDAEGGEVGRREGYLGEQAGEFVKILQRIIRKHGTK